MYKVKINWINVIKEHITKTKNRPEYHIKYVVLVSKFIEYFEVDVESEVVENVKAQHEVTAATLHKIGLKRVEMIIGFAEQKKKRLDNSKTKRMMKLEPVLLLLLEEELTLHNLHSCRVSL